MFQIPLSGTGSWIETFVLLAAGVVGLVYLYHTLAPRLDGWFAERSDAGLRTLGLLHKSGEPPERGLGTQAGPADLDLEATLHDALHPPPPHGDFDADEPRSAEA